MSYNSLLGLATHSVDANLLCHLLMQETSGTSVSDRSGNSYTGTLSGAANPATATGPTSYLTSAYDFDATDDIVTLNASAVVTGASERTYLFWCRPDTGYDSRVLDVGANVATAGTAFAIQREDTDDRVKLGFQNHGKQSETGVFVDDTWTHIAARVNASAADTDDVDAFADGVKLTMSTWTGTAQTLNTSADNRILGGGLNSAIPIYFDGKIAEFVSFSRALTDAEVLEIASGPEPENTVAPTVSGDTAQGSTLTCSPGTWALPSPYASGSNGTITYTYEWRRDGTPIGGATSSTYVTQAADIGTSVTCAVLGSNDGGSDSAEQTVSSNSIAVVAATNYRMNMRISISNSIGV